MGENKPNTVPDNVDRVIFMDVDGVLNDHRWCHIGGCQIKPECVECFQHLIKQSQAKCVLISSWRSKVKRGIVTLKGMEWMFKTHGLVIDLIDVLPPYENHDHNARSEAVMKWIESHKPKSYVVIDNADLTVPNFIKTHSGKGIEPHHVSRALELLGIEKP